MGYASQTLTNSPNYRLDINTWIIGQNVGENFTDVGWNLILVKTSGSGYWSNGGNSWAVNVDGQGWSGSFTYNFTQYSQLTLASGSKRIYHNADGSRHYGFSGYVSVTASRPGGGGSANPGGGEWLPGIPRASYSSLTPTIHDVQPGQIQTINTNRASGSFTHTIDWFFLNASGNIGNNVGDSVTWNPPVSILQQLPNSTTNVGSIRTRTYNGGTFIGETSFPFRINVPASYVPTFTSFNISESTPNVQAAVGGYVQGVSTLAWQINGASGVEGSTITGYSLSVSGISKSGQTGVTAPIAGSGTVQVVATVTDSRGRTATKTQNITVLPYVMPQVASYQARRANSTGGLDPDGDYLRIDLIAAVSSLIVGGVQKNQLSYRTKAKEKNALTFDTINQVTPGGITYNSFYVISPFAEDLSWDVRVEILDIFSVVAVQTSVAVAAITMHWDGEGGLGIGKFWEQGAVDIAGDVYTSGLVHSPATVVRLTKTGAGTTSPTPGENYTVSWSNDDFDSGAWSPAEPIRLYPPLAGVWRVTAKVRVEGVNTPHFAYLGIYLNDVARVAAEGLSVGSGAGAYPEVDDLIQITNPGSDFIHISVASSVPSAPVTASHCVLLAQWLGT